MTLQEFADRSGTIVNTTEQGAVNVVVGFNTPGRVDAWRLEDYIVSSSCGVALWFIPRPKGYILPLPG